MQQIIAVKLSPSSEFCKILVSLLSRKLMQYFCLVPTYCDSLLITFERASSDLLMLPPSLSRKPIDLQRDAPSEPARSTMFIQDDRLTLRIVCKFQSSIKMLILNTVCDRELWELNLVSATIRSSSPLRQRSTSSFSLLTRKSVKSCTSTFPSFVSRMSRFRLLSLRRSFTHSL